MSRILKKLNIEEKATSERSVPDLKLVQSEEFEHSVSKPKKKITFKQTAILLGMIFALLVLAMRLFTHRGSNENELKSVSPGISAEIKKLAPDDQLHAEAVELYRSKDYVKAVLKFAELQKSYPKDPAIRNNLGLSYLKLNEFKKAEHEFQEALKLDPKDGAAYNNYGSLRMAELNPEDAVSYFYQAILYHPEMTEPHLNLAKAFELSGHPMEAVPEYQRFLELTSPGGDPAIRSLIEKRISKLNSFSQYLDQTR